MKNLKVRVSSAIVFGIIFLLCILYNSLTYFIFFGLMIFGSAREFYRIYRVNQGKRIRRRSTGIAILLSLVPFSITIALEYYLDTYLWEIIPILISVIITIILAIDVYSDKEPLLFRMPLWLSTLIYPATLVSVITMTVFSSDGEYMKFYILLILLSTWALDVGAYVIGSQLGKNKLAPWISPNKTIEGAVGGVLASAIVGFLVSYFISSHWVLGLVLGISCGVLGVLGDLLESRLKRTAGVKDSGTFMPGHGGFLDRFDAFAFNLPFASLIIWLYLYF